jgi:hypothetical protein
VRFGDADLQGVLSLSTTVGNLPLPTFNEVRSWARAVLNANYLVGSDGSDYPDGCEEFHRPLDFDFIPLTDPHNPNNQAFIECLLDPGNMTLGEQFRWLPPMSRPSE